MLTAADLMVFALALVALVGLLLGVSVRGRAGRDGIDIRTGGSPREGDDPPDEEEKG